MDTLTVILHLTGLLLITPDSGSQKATHVLVPAVDGGSEAHVTRMFYFSKNDPGICMTYRDHMCIVSLENRELVIGRGYAGGQSLPPTETPDISSTSSRRVPHDRYTGEPTKRLLSRITFWAQERLTACAKAWWDFRGTPMRVPNVISYQLAHTGPEFPQITLTDLRPDSIPTMQSRLLAPDSINGEVHMFLYSVPPQEATEIEDLGRNLLSAVELTSSRATLSTRSLSDLGHPYLPTEQPPAYRAPARHYRAYYDLAGARWWNRRSEPRFLVPILDNNDNPVECPFSKPVSELTTYIVKLLSAASYSCLVATGTPAQ